MSFADFMETMANQMGAPNMGLKRSLEEAREKIKAFDPESKKLISAANKALSNMEQDIRNRFKAGDLVEQEDFSDYNFPVKGCPAIVLKIGKPGEFGTGLPGKRYAAEDMVIGILDFDRCLVTHSVESYRFKKVGSI